MSGDRAPAFKGQRAHPAPMAFADTLETDDREAYQAGIHAFNTGDFYAAHDHFEHLWGDAIWKGLVQAAVALHHFSVGNHKGIEGLPENVHRILTPYVPESHGLEVGRFLAAFDDYFSRIARGEDPPLDAAPRLERTSDR